MILDLEKFIASEQPYWQELETLLTELDNQRQLALSEVQRFHYLYQRASAGLGKLMTFSAEQEIRRYLEDLVARTYAEIHEVRQSRLAFSPRYWLSNTLPRTFRRHLGAFWLILTMTMLGSGFGVLALSLAPQSKEVLMPFDHLQSTPSERVAGEMKDKGKRLQGHQASFSTSLMTHNIKVSIFAMGLGLSYGLGTLIVIFYNGVILGAVSFDYIMDGQAIFLAGWLLPHGSVEIPAFLLAGQAGLVLAHAMIGRGDRLPFNERLRSILPDLVTLICGIALLLCWAGLIESFFSQYHEPLLPYELKITFGCLQLAAVISYFSLAGRRGQANSKHPTRNKERRISKDGTTYSGLSKH